MAKLPIGVQSFEKLRKNDCIYVDKTEFIYKLRELGFEYFLSRPRRFGKSLFISTLEAYFSGKRELFSGLSIERHEAERDAENQWQSYPVITFSLSGGAFQTEKGLAITLAYTLDTFEKRYGIAHNDALDLPTQFRHCIDEAKEITGKGVVVLVDEYDKPLLENMAVNEEQENKNREQLKSFFSILKDEDENLEFVFITGVTKFNKVSIFSDLNQLKDISLSDRFSEICGITEEEMEKHFPNEIEELAKSNELTVRECVDQLRDMYDGYVFSARGKSVYNPFSIMNAFLDLRFGSYWFSTGTPTFLIHKLRASRLKPVDFSGGLRATERDISDYRADYPDPVPLFYQTGYLTITGYDRRFQQYVLAFPNQEVKNGFIESIFPYYFNPAVSEETFALDSFIRDLDHGEVDAFMLRLRSLLASVNYPEGAAPYSEHDFQSHLYIIFTMLGKVVRTEVHTAKGRMDCEIEDGDLIYVMEFKVDQSAREALDQIDRMKYTEKYRISEKIVVKIGIAFSVEERNIREWLAEREEKPVG